MTYALSGNRLTWNVAVPWPFEKLDQLGSRRYIAQANDSAASADPSGKRRRSVHSPCLILLTTSVFLVSTLQ